jgi:hypothetical protein
MDTASAVSVLCHPGVSHLSSGFTTAGWACGYLNAQMLLSYVQEASPVEFRRAFGGDELPSIRMLQHFIQAGWAKGNRFASSILIWLGIDDVGASQLRSKLGILCLLDHPNK